MAVNGNNQSAINDSTMNMTGVDISKNENTLNRSSISNSKGFKGNLIYMNKNRTPSGQSEEVISPIMKVKDHNPHFTGIDLKPFDESFAQNISPRKVSEISANSEDLLLSRRSIMVGASNPVPDINGLQDVKRREAVVYQDKKQSHEKVKPVMHSHSKYSSMVTGERTELVKSRELDKKPSKTKLTDIFIKSLSKFFNL